MKGSAAAVVEKTAERLVDREQIVRIAARGALKHGVLPALGKRGVAPFAKRLVLHVGAALTHVDPVTRRDAPAALETLLDARPSSSPRTRRRRRCATSRTCCAGGMTPRPALWTPAPARPPPPPPRPRAAARALRLVPDAFGDMTASRVGASTPGARFRLLTACRRFLETLVSLSIDHGADPSLIKKSRERTTFAPFAVRDEALFDEALADDRYDVGAETRATHAFRLARPPLDAATAVLDAFGGGKASRAAAAERDDGGAGVPAAAADLAALLFAAWDEATPALRDAGGGGADGGTHTDLLVKTKAMTEALVCTRLALRLVDRADARACVGVPGRRRGAAGALAARVLGGGAFPAVAPAAHGAPSAGRARRVQRRRRGAAFGGRRRRWRGPRRAQGGARGGGGARRRGMRGGRRVRRGRVREDDAEADARRSPTRSPDASDSDDACTADRRTPCPTRSTRARGGRRVRVRRVVPRGRAQRCRAGRGSVRRSRAHRRGRLRRAPARRAPRARACAVGLARALVRGRARARARRTGGRRERGLDARGGRGPARAPSGVRLAPRRRAPERVRAGCFTKEQRRRFSPRALRTRRVRRRAVAPPVRARALGAETPRPRHDDAPARGAACGGEPRHRRARAGDPRSARRGGVRARAVLRARAPPSADPDAPRVPAKLGPFARLPRRARAEAVALLGCLPALSPATIRAVAHAALAPAAVQTEEKKRKRNGGANEKNGRRPTTDDDAATRAADAVAANVAAAPLALSTSFFAAVLTGAPEWDRTERVAGAAARALVDLGDADAWAGAALAWGAVAARARARARPTRAAPRARAVVRARSARRRRRRRRPSAPATEPKRSRRRTGGGRRACWRRR